MGFSPSALAAALSFRTSVRSFLVVSVVDVCRRACAFVFVFLLVCHADESFKMFCGQVSFTTTVGNMPSRRHVAVIVFGLLAVLSCAECMACFFCVIVSVLPRAFFVVAFFWAMQLTFM